MLIASREEVARDASWHANVAAQRQAHNGRRNSQEQSVKMEVDLGRRSLVLGVAAAGVATAAEAQVRTDTLVAEVPKLSDGPTTIQSGGQLPDGAHIKAA